jgi:hypothetical protein
MSDFRKIRITLDASYKDGQVLTVDKAIPTKIRLQTIPDIPKYQELNLRLAVEDTIAGELLEGLSSGDVYLSIERIPSVIDRIK